MKTTYSVNMIDSETPAAWMRLLGISFVPGNQDSGRCRYTVTVAHGVDAAKLEATLDALEAALDADADVLEYGVV